MSLLRTILSQVMLFGFLYLFFLYLRRKHILGNWHSIYTWSVFIPGAGLLLSLLPASRKDWQLSRNCILLGIASLLAGTFIPGFAYVGYIPQEKDVTYILRRVESQPEWMTEERLRKTRLFRKMAPVDQSRLTAAIRNSQVNDYLGKIQNESPYDLEEQARTRHGYQSRMTPSQRRNFDMAWEKWTRIKDISRAND